MVGFSKVITRDPMFGLLHPDKKHVGPGFSFVSQINPSCLLPTLGKRFPTPTRIFWAKIHSRVVSFMM